MKIYTSPLRQFMLNIIRMIAFNNKSSLLQANSSSLRQGQVFSLPSPVLPHAYHETDMTYKYFPQTALPNHKDKNYLTLRQKNKTIDFMKTFKTRFT